jgi:putative methionine-R-sulfoxide reductase with GAF domain
MATTVTGATHGVAVASGEAVVVQDVTRHPRYLTTLGPPEPR